MTTATKFEVRTWLGGGVVERQFADSVKEARQLAIRTKRDWRRFTNHAEVSYFGRGGKEVVIR